MAVLLKVRVQPNAPRNAVAGLVGADTFKIRITAPPHDGLANEKLIEYLAACLDVRKSALTIKTGQSSRIKLVAIEGFEQQALYKRLQGLIPCRN